MEIEQEEKINRVNIGAICVESNKFDVSELLGFIKIALSDEVIKNYLQVFEKRERLSRPDYIG